MKLLTKPIYEKLIANGRKQEPVRGTDDELDFEPVVKLFNPLGIGTWLLTELDPENPDIAFGLCDLGFPELGSVSISELQSIRLPLGLKIERDMHWSPKHSLNTYASIARHEGRIIA